MRHSLPLVPAALLATLALLPAGTGSAESSSHASVSASHWVVTDLGNLGTASVTVSDINDRGQVVGQGLTRQGSRGFIWQDGWMTALGQGRFAAARRINERGQIVGTSGSRAVAEEHPVLWEQGRMIDLRPRGGATAVNERGQVLGFRYVPEGNGFTSTSVIWEKGKMRDLGIGAFAINNRGQVVGAVKDHAALWQSGKITDLGPGEATDINDRGEIVGMDWKFQPDSQVFVWRNGTRIDLPSGTGLAPGADAINERGQVTGWLRVGDQIHAFLWEDGAMTDLGTLGGRWALPTAISNRGQVVGYSLAADGVQHAFLWQDGTMIRLGTPKGMNGPRYSRTRAIAINENNQIVGDNCYEDCGRRAGWATSKFAVVWTLR